MAYRIQLYRGVGFEPDESLALLPLVRESLERLLAFSIADMQVQLTLLEYPDDWATTGVPLVYNLNPNLGYAYVAVRQGADILYQHPHPLHELVSRPLQQRLKIRYPDENQWGYCLSGPGLIAGPIVRPTPRVVGAVELDPREAPRPSGLVLSRVEDPPPPFARLSDFGHEPPDDEGGAPVRVLVPRGLSDELRQTRQLSRTVEEGGFLIGEVFRDADRPDTWLVKVTSAMEAEHTGASLLHFTFTGDSYSARNRALRTSQRNEVVVGWYHTHLFPAREIMGLSSIDVTLHFGSFSKPWQLAGLINLDGKGRTLRFYVRQGAGMALCKEWAIDDERD